VSFGFLSAASIMLCVHYLDQHSFCANSIGFGVTIVHSHREQALQFASIEKSLFNGLW
jgi:hypothetical protein